MAQTRTLTPGYTVIHPNRDKVECKVVKVIVVAILLASVALMVLVTFGGWSKLEGLTRLNFAWCLAYLVLAYYVWRWSRGSLPIAAGPGHPAANGRSGRGNRTLRHQLV